MKEYLKGRKFSDNEDVTCTENGWLWKSRNNYSGTTESALCRNTVPSAYQLQGTMLKIDKFLTTYVVVFYVKLRPY